MYINRYYMNEEIKREDMRKYTIVSQITLDTVNRANMRNQDQEIKDEQK